MGQLFVVETVIGDSKFDAISCGDMGIVITEELGAFGNMFLLGVVGMAMGTERGLSSREFLQEPSEDDATFVTVKGDT